jgi:hypothetical protein
MFGYKYPNIALGATPIGSTVRAQHLKERKFRGVFDKDRRG